MRAIRSLLFVPGHKPDWIAKAVRSGVDGVIVDLEDSVPEEAKAEARAVVAGLDRSVTGDRLVLVRPNALDTSHFGEDVAAAVGPGVDGLLLPKLGGRDDVVRYDALTTAAEHARGVPIGGTEFLPCLETAASLEAVADIARAPRVGGLMAAAARDSDIAREVGFSWSPEGLETLHLRSRVVLAGRAAGLRCLLLGLWQEIGDLAGLRRFAGDNRAVGYTGQVLIHPSHVEVVNEVFGLSTEQRDHYRGLVAAFERGRRAGHGAVRYRGEHIDLAHARHARELLAQQGIEIEEQE